MASTDLAPHWPRRVPRDDARGRVARRSKSAVRWSSHPIAAGGGIHLENPLKVETRVQIPLGLQAKGQVRLPFVSERRVSRAVRPHLSRGRPRYVTASAAEATNCELRFAPPSPTPARPARRCPRVPGSNDVQREVDRPDAGAPPLSSLPLVRRIDGQHTGRNINAGSRSEGVCPFLPARTRPTAFVFVQFGPGARGSGVSGPHASHPH
jgi:hypothetical protein